MGKIMLNNIAYGSSSGLTGTELTQAEYDALPEEQKNNGLYFITDGDVTTGVDYIVEQGTSGIWTYRKWNSGIAECWGKNSNTFNITTIWGSAMYYASGQYAYAQYPFEFKEVPVCSVGHTSDGVSVIAMTSGSKATTTQTPYYQMTRAISAENVVVYSDWYIKGYWK